MTFQKTSQTYIKYPDSRKFIGLRFNVKQKEFNDQIKGLTGVKYILQIQLRAKSGSSANKSRRQKIPYFTNRHITDSGVRNRASIFPATSCCASHGVVVVSCSHRMLKIVRTFENSSGLPRYRPSNKSVVTMPGDKHPMLTFVLLASCCIARIKTRTALFVAPYMLDPARARPSEPPPSMR